jgi:hypothetical protein
MAQLIIKHSYLMLRLQISLSSCHEKLYLLQKCATRNLSLYTLFLYKSFDTVSIKLFLLCSEFLVFILYCFHFSHSFTRTTLLLKLLSIIQFNFLFIFAKVWHFLCLLSKSFLFIVVVCGVKNAMKK